MSFYFRFRQSQNVHLYTESHHIVFLCIHTKTVSNDDQCDAIASALCTYNTV